VVPEYIRGQILNLLQLIGINNENCSKGNAEERTKCIPVQMSNGNLHANSPNKPSTSKKKKRKPKKKTSTAFSN
jgi:hypothetical protein